ncbi:hypothetical protein ACJX0J_032295 [Zea mays]
MLYLDCGDKIFLTGHKKKVHIVFMPYQQEVDPKNHFYFSYQTQMTDPYLIPVVVGTDSDFQLTKASEELHAHAAAAAAAQACAFAGAGAGKKKGLRYGVINLEAYLAPCFHLEDGYGVNLTIYYYRLIFWDEWIYTNKLQITLPTKI